jgi:membrane-associated phospholipid phosphatase
MASVGPALMKQFLVTLPQNIIGCFKGRMILWHLLAILLTIILVRSGFDRQYFLLTRQPTLDFYMFLAAPIGGLVPLILPLALILAGLVLPQTSIAATGWAIGQAEFIGSLISSSYKAVTARAHPTADLNPDLSQVFHFGILRGGVFWGWPSSHTTIAFAMAGAVFSLFPKQKWLRLAAFTYATFIGLGVSMTIHWFSDFVAGAIIGTVIGVVVGKCFAPREPI